MSHLRVFRGAALGQGAGMRGATSPARCGVPMPGAVWHSILLQETKPHCKSDRLGGTHPLGFPPRPSGAEPEPWAPLSPGALPVPAGGNSPQELRGQEAAALWALGWTQAVWQGTGGVGGLTALEG